MKKIVIISLIIFFSLSYTSIIAQKSDSTRKFKEKIKKGWNFGVVPAIAFDSDIGFKYGLAINFYHYGDGTIYPKYLHSLYLEWSRTTKGSGINQFIYDSKHLIPGIRLTTEVSYFTERALDFYGFNGYEALYDSRYEDDSPDNALYRSRQYYRQERKLFRLRADFQGRFFNDRVRWMAGISNYNIKADTIDINRLNEGKSDDEKLPSVEGGLYGAYAYQYGIIPENQIHGGNTTLLKAGLIYDTRDNEPNPMHGLWSEVILIWAPKFIGNGEYSFSKVAITHRQYFTLIHNHLSFVYRIGYQAKLSGKIPWYMLPFIYNGGYTPDRDGLGGAKTMRGVLRNRVVGEDYLFGNLEFRWKFLQTFLFKQNLYLALNTFTDFGMVTGKYRVDTSGVDNAVFLKEMFPDEKEKLHISYGAGLHTALNQNFIIAINYGFVADKRDGDTGFYINFNWLF